MAGFDFGVDMARVAEGGRSKREHIVLSHNVGDHFAGFRVSHRPLGVLEPRLSVQLVGLVHLFQDGSVDENTTGSDSTNLPMFVGGDHVVFPGLRWVQRGEPHAGRNDPMMGVCLLGHYQSGKDGAFDRVGGVDELVEDVEPEPLVRVNEPQPFGVGV